MTFTFGSAAADRSFGLNMTIGVIGLLLFVLLLDWGWRKLGNWLADRRAQRMWRVSK